MDYTPRYSQPFSLNEAVGLDVSVITEEISRLQNSLKHLRDTQVTLSSVMVEETEQDPELVKAFAENQVVVGPQEERISILKMALTEKGVVAGSHYDLQPSARATAEPSQPTTAITHPPTNSEEVADDGVYL